jgi:hypothetical protein
VKVSKDLVDALSESDRALSAAISIGQEVEDMFREKLNESDEAMREAAELWHLLPPEPIRPPPRRATVLDYARYAWRRAQQSRSVGPWQVELAVTPLAWNAIPRYDSRWGDYGVASVQWLCVTVRWWSER